MHCGKCLYLTRKNDLADLAWWINFHREMGFEKMHICDHLIERNAGFSQLFAGNRDFLEMQQLKCIPNLKTHVSLLNQTYFKSYELMNIGEKLKTHQRLYNVLSNLIFNECYFSNIDKYRYVKVSDTDEIVLPMRIRELNKNENVVDYLIEDSSDSRKRELSVL